MPRFPSTSFLLFITSNKSFTECPGKHSFLLVNMTTNSWLKWCASVSSEVKACNVWRQIFLFRVHWLRFIMLHRFWIFLIHLTYTNISCTYTSLLSWCLSVNTITCTDDAITILNASLIIIIHIIKSQTWPLLNKWTNALKFFDLYIKTAALSFIFDIFSQWSWFQMIAVWSSSKCDFHASSSVLSRSASFNCN